MATVTINHITKAFGDNVVLKEFNETFQDGEFITLLGPSGCGKTTMLRIIAGFEKPTTGELYIDNQLVSGGKTFVPPEKRSIGMVFQSYAVWPHMNVFDNVAYPLTIKKVSKAEIKESVERVLKIVHLSQYAERFPNQLSGGQQQRVALARALVVEPGVLLFDEPLSNLDAKLRVQMRTEIRRIQQTLGITAIYVTHDQSEAMAISDNIILMKGGVIAQMDSPTEIYYHPNSEFVADFIGECNFLPCTVTGREGEDVAAEVYGHPVKVRSDKDQSGSAEIVLRPEAIQIADEGQLPCKVELSCFMGSYQNYHVRVGDTLVKISDNCPIGKKTFQVGDNAYISFRSECAHLLEAK